MKNISGIVKTYYEIDSQWLSRIQKEILQAQKLYKQIDFTQIQKTIDEATKIAKQNEKSKEVDKKYAAIMFKAGWPPILDFTNPQIRHIIKEYEETDFDSFQNELEQSLLSYFNDEYLRKKLSKWKKSKPLNNRIHILEKIIEAHIDKNYNLSVPVMLIQFEGLLAETYKHSGRLKGDKVMKYIKQLYSTENVLEPFLDATLKYFKKFVFSEFEWGATLASRLSRHAILHGADTNYASEVVSLKTILLFDFLLLSITLKN